ncbi:MAG: branched-chain amino acid ABC transporter permease [Firmicutes bacterium]|jgi:branched-chain amino acid transport system permease protein|nr:branched-chain amino acid ABC transporter permease [Bacillota bacterium]
MRMRAKRIVLGVAGVLVLIAAVPLVYSQEYFLHLCIMAMISAIVAVGLSLVSGYTGQMSLGHAGLYAVGAYTSALLTTRFGVSFWGAVPAVLVVSALAGVVIGAPSIRLKAGYLTISTVAFGEIVHQTARNWDKVTKGPTGIGAIPSPELFGLEVMTLRAWYYFAFVFLLIAVWISARIVNSHIGRALRAIREHEPAAQVMGINSSYYKVLVFVVSAVFAGMAGALYAHFITFIAPDNFTLNESIGFLVMTVVGGIGAISGAVFGAFVVTIIPEYLRAFGDIRLVLYGLILVLFVLFMPKGLVPFIAEHVRRWTRRATRSQASRDTAPRR